MMKKFLFLSIIHFCSCKVFSQNKSDSIVQVLNFAKNYDLEFTVAEADSMLENIAEFAGIYKSMHKKNLSNEIPYPFTFNPALYGFKKPVEPETQIDWGWDVIGLNEISLPADKNELAFYSVKQLGMLIKAKKISSVELTQFFISRLKKWGDTLKCIITLTEDLAMQQARQADEDLKRGIYHGPLHGIPYGLKDLFAVKGYKTTWGTAPYKDQVIDEDAFVYTQLKKAGAVLCAKLSMGSLAYDNKWFGGSTKNPWNLLQGSSGSSAGSASATSAGLLPFAIGTETQGSIISPSTRCGVTGLRPSFGSVSRSGAMVLCWSLDKVGPICRSAEDAAMVFAAIKGTDGKDGVDRAFNYKPGDDVRKLKIAYAGNYFNRPGVDSQQKKVLADFIKMGVPLKSVIFPDSLLYPIDLISIILFAESAAAFDPLTRNNKDDLIERQDKNFWPNIFRSARLIPAVEYIEANRHRYLLIKAMADFMKDYDVLIFPTGPGKQISITNLTGNPAVCLPVGFRKDGTPMSVTFIGNLYDEASILLAAKAYQDNTDHHKKHPPLFFK